MNFKGFSRSYYKNNLSQNNNTKYNNINNINNILNNNVNEYKLLQQNMIENIENDIILKTNNYEFILNYKKMLSGNEYFTIYNKNKEYCVRIKKDIDEENIIYLQKLNFFESCAKNKSLMRKTGTLEMLLCVLEYVKNFYNKNMQYIFQDDSTIKIYNKNLSLSKIYILLYGKTWYMKNIKAIAYDKNSFNDSLDKLNHYLLNNKDKLIYFFKKSFETLHDINDNDSINNTILNSIISDEIFNVFKSNNTNITKQHIWKEIKKIYKLSNNSRDFILYLYKKYGMNIFILLNYSEYIEYVQYKIKKIIHLSDYMIIPNEFINNINVLII